MNIAVARKHYLIAIDWSQRMLEQWAEQYGAWLRTGQNINLGASSSMRYIVESANGVELDRSLRKAIPRCVISDEEGFAFNDLLCDMLDTDSEVVKEWLLIFDFYYIQFRSDEWIATHLDIGRFAVIQNKKCAIAHICAKRTKIKSNLTARFDRREFKA